MGWAEEAERKRLYDGPNKPVTRISHGPVKLAVTVGLSPFFFRRPIAASTSGVWSLVTRTQNTLLLGCLSRRSFSALNLRLTMHSPRVTTTTLSVSNSNSNQGMRVVRHGRRRVPYPRRSVATWNSSGTPTGVARTSSTCINYKQNPSWKLWWRCAHQQGTEIHGTRLDHRAPCTSRDNRR